MQLSDLQQGVLDRLEEGVATFWNATGEILPFLVEAMNEATLITGEPQVRAGVVYDIPASVVFNPLPLPSDALALLRVEGANTLPLKKVFIYDLDRHYPGWEKAVGNAPKAWFPFGLNGFGIYPNLTADAQVILNYVQMPVNVPRPYTGNETVPFLSDYMEGFQDYAAHVARLKEAGAEFDQSFSQYNRFLAKMEQLSNFSYRKNSLRFTRQGGAPSDINEVRAR